MWYGSPSPPPWWQAQGQQYIPVPPGTDTMKAMEFVDRMYRRAQRAEDKKKDKGKDDKKPKLKETMIWYFQAACILYFLSPPIAMLNHLISTIAATVIK